VLEFAGRGRLSDYSILSFFKILRKDDRLGYLSRLLEGKRRKRRGVRRGNLKGCVLDDGYSWRNGGIEGGSECNVHFVTESFVVSL
ncbi:hypothetical protein PENTCL1PPCAC_6039, partial [Pristionchus entomophagus]